MESHEGCRWTLLYNLTWTDPPKLGAKIEITGRGSLKQPVEDGSTFTLVGHWGPTQIQKIVELLALGMDNFFKFGRSFCNWDCSRTVLLHSQKTYDQE